MKTCIKGITSMAMRDVLSELARDHERLEGPCVELEAAGGVDVKRRIEQGESFDFVVLARQAIDELATARHVAAGTALDLALSAIAVAVAAGASRPRLATARDVKEAVLAARAVGLSTGPSGKHLREVLRGWGVAGARVVESPPGVPVAALIARGEVDLGFQQSSELMNAAGIEILGLLPHELQKVTVFAGAVCVASTQPDAARDMLAFCASPQASEAKRRYGMEPLQET
jgi:molybdate transport system substrate-binding protein